MTARKTENVERELTRDEIDAHERTEFIATLTVAEIMAIVLTRIKTTCAATITETKSGGQFGGTIEFDWRGRTVADVLRFATADRRIALAPSIRKNIVKHRSTKTIKSVVAAPGVRDAATRIVTESDVETYLNTVDQSVIDGIMERVNARRSDDDTNE
jgi:hypothetical protein